jgi:Fe-S-cluster containining protein
MVNMHFENVVFPDSVSFRCKNCGVCCRDQPPDINLKEQQRLEARGFVDFLDAPNDPNNRSIRRKKDGSCIFFTEENTCKIHDVKPSICLLEPFIITDFDFKTNKIFVDLNPLAVKNCKGICNGEMGVPEEIGKAAQTIVQEFLEIVAANTGLPVTDKRVALLTRKLLRS